MSQKAGPDGLQKSLPASAILSFKTKEAMLGSPQGWPCQVSEVLLVIALLDLLQALGMLRQRPGPTGCDKGVGISLRVGFH